MNNKPTGGGYQTQDVRIDFKNVRIGTDSKGNERLQLSIGQEMAAALIEALSAEGDNSRGVKLDIHITHPTTKDGRPFDSGYLFVKGIQEFVAQGGGGFASTPSKFQRKGTTSDSTRARASKLKTTLSEDEE